MGHTLVLVRHGEHLDAEHGVGDGRLSERGQAQAEALADRLSKVSFANAWSSTFDSATDTARVLGSKLSGVTFEPSPLLIECVPSGPSPDMPAAYESFFTSISPAQIEAGRAQMDDAIAEFLRPGKKGQVDLLVTHNAVIAWLTRHVMESPDWRWLSLTQAHCAVTVLQQRPGRPWTVVTFNDMSHLPRDLRTGLVGGYSL